MNTGQVFGCKIIYPNIILNLSYLSTYLSTYLNLSGYCSFFDFITHKRKIQQYENIFMDNTEFCTSNFKKHVITQYLENSSMKTVRSVNFAEKQGHFVKRYSAVCQM